MYVLYCATILLFFVLTAGQYQLDATGQLRDDVRLTHVRRWRTACPRNCVCMAGNVYCDGVALRSMPRHIQSDTHTIYMRDNYIRRLPYRRLRGLVQLRNLLLKNNRIIEIEHNAFQDLQRLISLSLTDNQLHYLPPDVFNRLTNLRVVSIRNNKLRHIDIQFSNLATLELLNLANNRLKSINARTFNGTIKLRILDLHKNQITHIARKAFSYAPLLQYLVLRDNPLHQVSLEFHRSAHLKLLDVSYCGLTEIVKGLPRIIDDLRLNNNEIREIQEDDFKNTKKVRLLVLNNNQLNFVHEKSLSGLEELYDLYVGRNALPSVPVVPNNIHGVYANYNNITKLSEGTFPFSTRLEFIFLRYNDISEIDDTAFHGLRFMRSLDLSRNKIMALKRYTFQYMSKLELLDLTKNPLEELEYGCFHGLRSLSILQMSSVTTKSSIMPSTFRDLRQLQFLDLSNSSTLVENLARNKFNLPPFASVQDLNLMDDHLHNLPPDFPHYFPELRIIKLLGNPWHCNKTILWLVDWMNNSSVEFFASNYMTCATPPQLKGRALQSLEPTELAYDLLSDNRINLDDYNLIFEIIDGRHEDKEGTLTPGKLELDIFPKRGTETSGFTGRRILYDKDSHKTHLNPYGQVALKSDRETLKKEKMQNSVIKDEHNDAVRYDAQYFDDDHIRELREGSNFHEVSRSTGATALYDDSSGFVSADEFLIV